MNLSRRVSGLPDRGRRTFALSESPLIIIIEDRGSARRSSEAARHERCDAHMTSLGSLRLYK
jgi:hypothetical protein